MVVQQGSQRVGDTTEAAVRGASRLRHVGVPTNLHHEGGYAGVAPVELERHIGAREGAIESDVSKGSERPPRCAQQSLGRVKGVGPKAHRGTRTRAVELVRQRLGGI